MKSIKKIRLIVSLICSMLMASCNLIDFSEDCTYYGDVEIRPDWSGLAQDDTRPALTDIYLLSLQRNYMYSITSDTLVTDVQAVSYKLLAYNSYGLENISFSGMDCPNTAKAELATFEDRDRLYTVQAPALYAANTDLTVIPFESVVSEPVLKPATRQINIDFVVIDNTDTGVSAISGELSGIAYKYGFKDLDALESSAWLTFDSRPDTEKKNRFSSSLKAFGVNPDKQGAGSIDNLLEIALQTTDGNTFCETVGLTDIFSGFTARSIHITIQVRISLMGIEVSVTDWSTGHEDHIDL